MKNKNLVGNIFTKEALTAKETALSASIKDYLDAHSIYNDRLNSGVVQIVKKHPGKNGWREYRNWLHLCAVGTPDRFAVISGFIIFIEVKQRGKLPTAVQLAKHDELRAKAGAYVIVCDSFEDFERKFGEVRAEIRRFKTKKENQTDT